MLFLILFISACSFNCRIHAKLLNIPEDVIGCEPDCSSVIYCMGKGNAGGPGTLLHDVQMNKIFGDDGTVFVRKKMKFSEEEILRMYEIEKRKASDNRLSVEQLKRFVNDTFEDDNLLEDEPTDFKENPSIINKVDPSFQPWLSDLNHLWKNFTRKLSLPVENITFQESRHSYMYVPNRFVVAGGRFQEMYYWDSYWIIRGLLACEMYDTARGIMENMIYLIEKLGYMPNGNRRYYLKRSQPPMLVQMAAHYFEVTKNETFIKINLKTFDKEFEWWYNNRRMEVNKNGQVYTMFHYNSSSCFPRPESYRQDYNLLEKCTDVNKTRKIFTGIRSGAESGWDFSSRHMKDPYKAKMRREGLTDMNPEEYAYVDLNSIIYSNARLLAEWNCKFDKNEHRVKFYEKISNRILDTIENVLWNEKEGIWLDYDTITGKHRNFFFASNFLPLWSKTYHRTPEKVDRAIEYLKRNEMIDANLESKYFGIPTSNIKDSVEQWDFPNAWAPLQSFIIQGFYESNNTKAQQVAFNLAKAFVNTSFTGYYKNKTNPVMYEKYNAEKFGESGTSGEYTSQTGFGWTNGFIFELFTIWNNLTFHN